LRPARLRSVPLRHLPRQRLAGPIQRRNGSERRGIVEYNAALQMDTPHCQKTTRHRTMRRHVDSIRCGIVSITCGISTYNAALDDCDAATDGDDAASLLALPHRLRISRNSFIRRGVSKSNAALYEIDAAL